MPFMRTVVRHCAINQTPAACAAMARGAFMMTDNSHGVASRMKWQRERDTLIFFFFFSTLRHCRQHLIRHDGHIMIETCEAFRRHSRKSRITSNFIPVFLELIQFNPRSTQACLARTHTCA
jgi:hypothetical protein